MKRILVFLCAVMLVFGFVAQASAAVLTFDDITSDITGNVDLPAGYGGFTWDNVGYFHKQYALDNYPSSNYPNGVVSGNYAAYNDYGYLAAVSDSTFDFNGAYFTSAYNDSNLLTVTGFLGGVQKYQQTVELGLLPAAWFSFDFLGVDEITLASSNLHFVMDDFTYNNSVPEPATLLLIGSGLIGLAGFRRKFRES